MSKILVMGLDGATWDLLMPLAKEGFLPTLARLMQAGSYGELESTMPPVTAPAWASFATGKNPGKTGIFDFLIPRSSLDDLAPITSKDISGKTFYEILEENGKKTIMVNLPLSYPPRTGSPTITSILTQGDQFIFPASLEEKIPELEEYRIVPDFDLKVQGRDEEYFEDIRKLEEVRFRCSQKLFEWEWDFFFVLFSGTDWIQHELYGKLISGTLNKNHVAFQLFRDIDSYIGWFADHLPQDAYLVIMSDHGFAVYLGAFNINQCLKENKFVETQQTANRPIPHQHRFVEEIARAQLKAMNDKRTVKKISIALPSYLVEPMRRLGFGKIYSILQKYVPIRLKTTTGINYARSRAVCTTSQLSGVYLNLSTRFLNGIIERQDASRIKQEIISSLRQLKDPITGEDAFTKVVDSQEIYSGGRTEIGPDILVFPRNFLVRAAPPSDVKVNIFEQRVVNDHAAQGIFLAYGPAIKKNYYLDGTRIYDISPTILHIIGVPIPRDMDGRVLTELFEHGSEIANRPVDYASVDEKEHARDRIRRLKRLKGL